MSDFRQNLALVVVLLLAGSASWAFRLGEPLEVDATPLAALPSGLLSWSGRDIPMSGTVEQVLRADQHVQRSYEDAAGGRVWLYVGYYGTARGGRSEHSPWVCYPSAGWEVLAEHSRKLGAGSDSELQEIVVQRGIERRLVHFWYRTSRSEHVVGPLAHAWDRFVGRLTLGRADGAFVRLSTPLRDQSLEAARARLLAFGHALDEQLAAHWPVETGSSRDG